MKRRKQLVTQFADGLSQDSAALSDAQHRQAMAHRKVADLIGSTYATSLPVRIPASFASRMLARARQEYFPSFADRLPYSWHKLFRHPVWTFSTALAMLLIVSISLWFSKTLQQSQPAQMDSFVIYQTDDGNGFVRYFKYYKVDSDGNKLYL